MLVIRLSRTGRKKYPTYRIVAADSKRAATGKFVMILGHYNPHTKELVIKKDETTNYIKNGAQPSNAIIKLFKQEKINLPEWAKLKTRDRKPKKAAPAPTAAPVVEAEAAVPEAATEAAPEAVAESVKQSPDAKAEPVSEAPAAIETASESVAEVAQAEVEAVATNAESVNLTETAESEQAQADKAEKSAEASTKLADAPQE